MPWRFSLALTLFCLTPAVALADGVSPILNLFHKDTWLPATLVTVLIILIESALLRLRVKQIRYIDTLWRCVVINIASSAAGSVLLLGLGRDSYFLWDSTWLVLPLFLLTLVTEIPLLRLLYKQVALSWKRAVALGVGINLASYAVVFAAEIGLFIGMMAFAGHSDRKELAQWVHPELLTHSTGQIYATESTPDGSHRLRLLDTRTAHWLSLTNCPSLDPNRWDVEGRTCAFGRWPAQGAARETVVIASLPEFSIVREVSLSALVDPQSDRSSNRQGISDLALSPDAKKLAVLFQVADAVAYKDNSSHFELGPKCILAVYSVDSGQQLSRASRYASGSGLCWFPDSSAVLFTSFKDEAVYKTAPTEVRGDVGVGIGYAKSGRFKMGLFSFNVTTGEVRWFTEGIRPAVSAASRQFIIRDGDTLRIVDTQGRSRVCEGISRIGYSPAVLSPCGKLVLAQTLRHQAFFAGGRLTVIDLAHPTLRHIVADNLVYRFKWTTTGEGPPGVGVRPVP
jgi:hypothetical protein